MRPSAVPEDPYGPARLRVHADLVLEVDAGADGATTGTVTSDDGHVVLEVDDPAVLLRALGPVARRGSPLPALVPPGASGELRHRGRVLAAVLPAPRLGVLGRGVSAVVGNSRLVVRPALALPLLRAGGAVPAAAALGVVFAAVVAARRRSRRG